MCDEEDKAKFTFEGLPLCPNCHVSMYCDSSGDRDLETMGGYSIEYYKCDKCQHKFQLINGKLFGDD